MGQEKIKKIMENKKILVVVGVVVLLAVLGVVLNQRGFLDISDLIPENTSLEESEGPEDIFPEGELNGLSEEQERIQALILEAAEKNDRSICDTLENEAEKEQCITHFLFNKAVQEKDASVCNEIEQEAQIQGCKDNVYFVRAITEQDIELCDNIENETISERCRENVNRATE